MADFLTPENGTKNIFSKVLDDTMLSNYITSKVLVNNKQSEIGRATKVSDLNKVLSNVDLAIIVNEEVFKSLLPEDQKLVAESVLAGVHFDTEKDKLVVNKGDIPAIHSGVVSKYGVDKYFNVMNQIREIFSQKKDAKEQETSQN